MYIQMVSIHGLIRGKNVEMGRDADTGGQVRYVLDLALTLSNLDGVDGVDLFTRQIKDKRVSKDYSQSIEELGPKCRLVRLPCGGGRYIRKERLWPYLDDFVDQLVTFTRKEGKIPNIIHGHYADAGYVAKEAATAFGVPFVFTGHSLGQEKFAYLLEQGLSEDAVDKEFRILNRIKVEEECLAVADMVVTSTRHERDEQYGKYYNAKGARFEIIPPGIELDRFFPYYDYEISGSEISETYKQARMSMTQELERFYLNADKPIILAVCRPDKRKNISALVDAYGQDKELQGLANLAVFAGIRKDITKMEDSEREVLTDILLMMDSYDLYGHLAIPKQHDSEYDVPELYRLAASKRGVFVNPSFKENFGLTLIEASAVGLPFVASNHGGPIDIAANCDSGTLVDVEDHSNISGAMKKMLSDRQLWERMSNNGINHVRQHYSWEAHCKRYMECSKQISQDNRSTVFSLAPEEKAPGRRLGSVKSLLLVEIDETLIGDNKALVKLTDLIDRNRDEIAFGVVSGRHVDVIVDVLQKNNISKYDVLISSVGSEIYYGSRLIPDKGWASHLRARWRPDRIRNALNDIPFLHMQKVKNSQREFKISYDLDKSVTAKEAMPAIHEALHRARTAYSLVFSHGTYVDILPHRASKGKAVRYLSAKWSIPLELIATAGYSGNDRDMLVGQTAGIVVGNYDKELESLRRSSARVYFAQKPYADGIIEGLEHFGILKE